MLVAANWLRSYSEAFSRWPDASIFGGRVTPWFEVEPPTWLGHNVDLLGGVYALRDFGEEERLLPEHENPYGANMAFLAADLKAYPFDPKLGRVADNLTSGEESAVIRAMRNDGHKVVWVPASEVSHFLPKSRMTFSYIFSFRRAVGANESEIDRCTQRCLFGVPLWIIRRRIYWEIQYHFDRITRPNSRSRIQSMSRAANLRGEWEAYRKAWRERI